MTLTQISTAGVKDDAVTSGKIPANAVGSSELADNAVDTAAIVDQAVTTGKLANGSVDYGKLADSAVIASKIASGAVTNAKLADNSVSLAKMQNNSVGTNEIADDAVTQAKIAAGAIGNSELATNSVQGGNLTNSAISDAKIHPSANIAGSKLADNSISLAKLEHGTSSNNGKFLRANNGADPTFETVETGAKNGGTIFENLNTISNTYTVTNNSNAFSAGPMTIANGGSVVVGSGETYTII